MGKPREPVILGIDWGSTAIRLALYYVNTRRVEIVWNSESQSGHDEYRYEKGAWNGYINISGHGPVWTGDKPSPSNVEIPAKLIPGKGKGLDWANPLYAEVRRNRGNKAFERRCEEGMKQIVLAFAAEMRTLCENRHAPLEIVDIGLSAPAHWTLDEEERYTRLIRETFPQSSRWNNRLRNLYFSTEIEAVAHFICDDASRSDGYLGGPGNNYVLFLDFGGHSMNGCIFYVRKTDRGTAFFRAQDPFGVIGGTEHWEASVSDFCTRHTVSDNWRDTNTDKGIDTEIRNSLLEQFRKEVRRLEADVFAEMELRASAPKGHPSDAKDFYASISAETSAEFFRGAMDRPIEMAEKNMIELSRLGQLSDDIGALVVVTGGSGKNMTVRARLQRCCKTLGLPEPRFMYEKTGGFESFNIARGAALAAANHLTLGEFIQNGAAFRLQMKEGQNSNGEWEDVAALLPNGKSLSIYASGKDRIKIICDPFWEPKPRQSYLDYCKAYDVLDLLIPTQGYWEFVLSLQDDAEDGGTLLLQRSRVLSEGLRIHPLEPVLLKLRYERSANCFLVTPDKELDSLHCGLGILEDGELVALTEEFERSLKAEVEQREAQRARLDDVGGSKDSPAKRSLARGSDEEPDVRPPKRSRKRSLSGSVSDSESSRGSTIDVDASVMAQFCLMSGGRGD